MHLQDGEYELAFVSGRTIEYVVHSEKYNCAVIRFTDGSILNFEGCTYVSFNNQKIVGGKVGGG